MKNRFLFVLFTALFLTFCFAMPVCAGGGADVYFADEAITDGYYNISSEGVVKPGNASSYNFRYDEANSKIVFNDMGQVYLEKGEGLTISKDMTVEVKGFSSLNVEGTSESTYLRGIYCRGDLNFIGDIEDDLFVEIDPDNPEKVHACYGIYVEGDITVNASVLPCSGEAHDPMLSSVSYGIYCEGDFTLDGGYLQPIACESDNSIALYADGNIVVNGGIINGSAYGVGCMIKAGDSFIFNDGVLDLWGDTCGIYGKINVSIHGGSAVIIAENDDYGIRAGIGNIYVDGGSLNITCNKQALYNDSTSVKPDLAKDLHLFAGKDENSLSKISGYNGEPCLMISPFKDLNANWYLSAVAWAVAQGVTNGISANEFAPDKTCTRAQIVTFLYRMEGSPEVSGNCSFVDVEKGIWYEDAVKWAVKEEITKGMDDTHFKPDAPCTRAQVACFLYRFCGSPKVSYIDNPFVDIGNGGEYYSDAVMFLYSRNITAGIDTTHFGPDNSCTRAQIVTFLYRLYSSVS